MPDIKLPVDAVIALNESYSAKLMALQKAMLDPTTTDEQFIELKRAANAARAELFKAGK